MILGSKMYLLETTVARSLSAGQHSAPLDLGRTLTFIWLVYTVHVNGVLPTTAEELVQA